jgi:hypothetical protein
MLQKFRPGGWVPPSRGASHRTTGNGSSHTKTLDSCKQVARPGRVFGGLDLTWHGSTLKAGTVTLAEIKSDSDYPGMFRVVMPATAAMPDARITDMVNLSRARDAAVTLALAVLNRKHAEETPLGGPLVSLNGRGRS